MSQFDRIYVGKANPQLHGKRCRILINWRRKGPHNVLVEFTWGERIMCPIRCLRKVKQQPGQECTPLIGYQVGVSHAKTHLA